MSSRPSPDRPSLAITMGDPAGIGPEIVVRVLNTREIHRLCRPFVVGDGAVLGQAADKLGLPDPFRPGESKAILLDQSDVPPKLKRGRISAAAGRSAARYVQIAANLAFCGTVKGIVTAPINKRSLALAGIEEKGHTEMLAKAANSHRVAMMFWSRDLSVVLFTIHIPLEEAIRRIRREPLARKIVFVRDEWTRYFGASPRIAVAGLNPHAGEGGLLGEAEKREIVPAIRKVRRRGVDASGPHPADTVFARAIAGEFDVVLALYHDQGLIPIKTHARGRSVNVTLGLPFVRTSVDHGTAYDIAGDGVANPASLMEAVRLAALLASRTGNS